MPAVSAVGDASPGELRRVGLQRPIQPILATPPPTRRFSRTKHPIRRALDPAWPSVQDVSVDLRRAHITVPEQFLNRPDVMGPPAGAWRTNDGTCDSSQAWGCPPGGPHP